MARATHRPALRVAAALVRPILTLTTKPTWLGREHIPDGPVIFAANHLSVADPFVIAHFIYDLPRDPLFLAKSTLFSIPVAGSILRACGQIPVYRRTARASDALAAAADALDNGDSVIIYPEGTRTRDPEFWPMVGKTGAIRLAIQAGVPLVPLAQWGSQKIHNHQTRSIKLWRSPVTVQALPPIDLTALETSANTEPDPDNVAAATQTLMVTLRSAVANLRREAVPETPLFDPREARP